MALKKLNVKVEETKRNTDMLEVQVAGDEVAKYNAASEAQKAAIADMNAQGPILKDNALGELFVHNAKTPGDPATSVLLVDETGKACRCSFTAKYSQVNGEQASVIFDNYFKGRKVTLPGQKPKPVDINDFVVETVVTSFNSAVFLDQAGNFDDKIYNKFKLAVDRVAKELKMDSPMGTKKVVLPKPNFHALRWTVFTAEDQAVLNQALPNVTQLVPVVEQAKKAK